MLCGAVALEHCRVLDPVRYEPYVLRLIANSEFLRLRFEIPWNPEFLDLRVQKAHLPYLLEALIELLAAVERKLFQAQREVPCQWKIVRYLHVSELQGVEEGDVLGEQRTGETVKCVPASAR